MAADEASKKQFSLAEYFKSGYILVADDHSNMRKTIKNMLRSVGITNVVEADDGDTALKAVKSGEEKCLFMLLDWNMPRMPGIFCAREIRADGQIGDLPILMVTAEVDRAQITQAGEIGVNGYIIKPFVAKALEEKIYNILESRLNPPEYIRLLKAGETLVKMGQFDKALAVFNEAKKMQESARVMVHIGDLHEIMGENEKALQMYRQAMENNPQYLKAIVKTATLYEKTGDESNALKALERAAEISPRNSDRHMSIGKIHLKQGNEERATLAFNEAVKADPKKTNDIAETLMDQGKPQLAEAFFRKTLETNQENIHLYNRIGIALRRQGKWRDAIKEYETAIKIDPRDEGIYFNMAKAYIEGQDYESARKYFNRVLQLNPRLQEAKQELAALDLMMQQKK